MLTRLIRMPYVAATRTITHTHIHTPPQINRAWNVSPSSSSSTASSLHRSLHTSNPRSAAAIPDSELVQWQNFNSGGLRLLAQGQHEKASLLFMSAMREPVVNNTVYQYLSLSNLGIAFRHLGRFDESRTVLMQALHALKNYPQIHDGMIANLYREAALACESLGQLAEAEGNLNHSLHYYSQHSLANEHASSKGQPSNQPTDLAKIVLETAATHYTLALLIHKTATAKATEEAATAKGKNLQVHLRLREAERHYTDALKMMRAVYGTEVESQQSLLIAPILSSMGTMYSELSDTPNALSHWMEALTIYQHHQDPRLLPILDAYMALLQKQDPAYAQILQQQQQQTTETSTPSGQPPNDGQKK